MRCLGNLGSSGMYPRCIRISGLSPSASWLKILIVPSFGLSKPRSIFMVVVLPAPLGPRNPCTVLVSTSRFSLLTATSVPYFFVRFSVFMADFTFITMWSGLFLHFCVQSLLFILSYETCI